ncbi:MAG: ATP-binding protein [Candidatus Zixiibacteriota bacterium]
MKSSRGQDIVQTQDGIPAGPSPKASCFSSEDFSEFERILEKNAGYRSDYIQSEHQSIARYIQILEETLKISAEINGVSDIDIILDRVMQRLGKILSAERGYISLYNIENKLQVAVTYRVAKSEINESKTFDYDYVVTQVVVSGEPVFSSDAAHDERFAHLVSVPSPQHSFLCAPFKIGDEVLGAVFLESQNKTRIFTESDFYHLRLLAGLVSPVIAQAKRFQTTTRLKNYKEALTTSSPVGTVVISPEGWIADINQAAFEVFDLNVDDVRTFEETSQPANFIEILPESEKPRWSRMINTVLTTRQVFADSRFTHHTGYMEKILSIKIYPVANFPYSDYGLTILVEDVTERAMMDKYMIISEKMVARGEMAARVAHKLNNFLSVIANNTELLNLNFEKGRTDKVKFNVRTIINSVFKIKDFLEELAQSPPRDSRVISFNINHLINDLLFSLNDKAHFKEIYFTLNLQEDIPNIEIDVGQVQNALQNLLTNAAEAIEEKSLKDHDENFKRRLTIDTKFEKSTNIVSIVITDNGTGIKKRHLDKIFNIHFSTKKNGHGLGLYHARSIVERHHGRIFVTSKPGEGTTVTVTFPRFQPRQPDINV